METYDNGDDGDDVDDDDDYDEEDDVDNDDDQLAMRMMILIKIINYNDHHLEQLLLCRIQNIAEH